MSEEESKVTESENKTEEQVKTEGKAGQKVDLEELKESIRKEVEATVAEKVRKEEKDKLYPEIMKLKEQLKEKDTGLEEAHKAVKDYEDKNLTAEEKTNKLLQSLVDTNEKLQKQLETVRVESEKSVRGLQLATFKEKLISSFQGEIIEGLVSGEDEVSLTASATASHEKYLEIAEVIGKQKTEDKQKTAVGTDISPVTDRKVKGIDMTDIDNVTDPNEWAKIRKDALAKAGILV